MTTPLFSTYRQGENRVTATFLAVLERLSLPNINRILGEIIQLDFSLVSFENQPKRKHSTPDAVIGTGQSIVIETKTDHNALCPDQVERELKDLHDGETLLVLTPDESLPPLLDKDPFLDDHRVIWSNFITLASAIEDVLNGKDGENEPPTEREAFLLREFIAMLEGDGLLFYPSSRVMVIPAREAWDVYKNKGVHAYITHRRKYRPSGHLAFYADRKIQRIVPKIELTIDSVRLSQDGITHLHGEERGHAKELLSKLEKIGMYENITVQVLFLSGPDDAETENLKEPIINDNNFTYGSRRYVTLESLKKASKTSELEHC